MPFTFHHGELQFSHNVFVFSEWTQRIRFLVKFIALHWTTLLVRLQLHNRSTSKRFVSACFPCWRCARMTHSFFPHCYMGSTEWLISNNHGMKFIMGSRFCSLNLKWLSTTPFHSRHFLRPPNELLIHYMLAITLSCFLVVIAFSCSLIVYFFLFVRWKLTHNLLQGLCYPQHRKFGVLCYYRPRHKAPRSEY
jgi:hypothetical protein